MKIALLGYGQMGKTIEKIVDSTSNSICYKTSSPLNRKKLHQADVAIDFSVSEAAVDNISTCLQEGIPVVSGTTGWLEHYDEMVDLCHEKNGSFLYASNFSIGMNLFFQLNQKLATMMAPFEEYDLSIEEIHHTKKRDKPSGTAISLAKDIIDKTDKKDWTLINNQSDLDLDRDIIPVKAKRFEDVKGTHKISYRSAIDAIDITHTAFSREGFAKGALLAAKFIRNKHGVFSMAEVINQSN